MEKSRLSLELKNIIDQFAKFRNKYSTLKTHYAAQEELIKLQKIELEKVNSRLDQLTTGLIDYQRRFNVTVHNLESENQRLQRIVDNTRENGNEYILEVHRNNNDQIRSLEENLTALRSEIITENEKHQVEIDTMKKRHDEEITMYKKKLEECGTLEDRHIDEIACNKEEVMEKNSKVQKSIELRKKPIAYAHPALEDSTEYKRKKTAPASFRWPPLEFSVKKEMGATVQLATQTKRRKLYHADNETIVDITL